MRVLRYISRVATMPIMRGVPRAPVLKAEPMRTEVEMSEKTPPPNFPLIG